MRLDCGMPRYRNEKTLIRKVLTTGIMLSNACLTSRNDNTIRRYEISYVKIDGLETVSWIRDQSPSRHYIRRHERISTLFHLTPRGQTQFKKPGGS